MSFALYDFYAAYSGQLHTIVQNSNPQNSTLNSGHSTPQVLSCVRQTSLPFNTLPPHEPALATGRLRLPTEPNSPRTRHSRQRQLYSKFDQKNLVYKQALQTA